MTLNQKCFYFHPTDQDKFVSSYLYSITSIKLHPPIYHHGSLSVAPFEGKICTPPPISTLLDIIHSLKHAQILCQHLVCHGMFPVWLITITYIAGFEHHLLKVIEP